MKNPWIRLYRDSLHNPKIVMLNDRQHRGWHNCLLMADDTGALPKVRDMACHMRMTIQEAEQVLCELVDCGLIDIEGTGPARIFKMHDWSSHQYVSDSSTERVRKFRKKNNETSDETAMKRFTDVTVTPPEQKQIQNRTDSETEAEPETRGRAMAVNNLFSGKAGRAVSARLKAKAEGCGLPVAAFEQRSLERDVGKPNGMFKHLCIEELKKLLPRARAEALKAAFEEGNDAAYGNLQAMLMEAL